MEYQVPQFVEIESKIVGPLTLKQFIYVSGGIGLCIALLRYLPIFIAIILCIPVVSLSGALAFYKINNKPFISILEAAVHFYTSSKLFLWHKEAPLKRTREENSAQQEPRTVPKHLTRENLHSLAGALDADKQKPTGFSSSS